MKRKKSLLNKNEFKYTYLLIILAGENGKKEIKELN